MASSALFVCFVVDVNADLLTMLTHFRFILMFCFVSAEEGGTTRKLTLLYTKQCIISCELSSNSDHADKCVAVQRLFSF